MHCSKEVSETRMYCNRNKWPMIQSCPAIFFIRRISVDGWHSIDDRIDDRRRRGKPVIAKRPFLVRGASTRTRGPEKFLK